MSTVNTSKGFGRCPAPVGLPLERHSVQVYLTQRVLPKTQHDVQAQQQKPSRTRATHATRGHAALFSPRHCSGPCLYVAIGNAAKLLQGLLTVTQLTRQDMFHCQRHHSSFVSSRCCLLSYLSALLVSEQLPEYVPLISYCLCRSLCFNRRSRSCS